MVTKTLILLAFLICIAFGEVILLSSAAAAKPTCVARKTIIDRGQKWVTAKVPYSQTKYHEGYRTDCSGFVSMCWGLAKPGLVTWTFKSVAKNITKNELKPGDAINCEARHILLFVGWTNSSKTHYTSMEEANSKTGTVKRVTPYPYWNGDKCFHPIRYTKAC